MARFTQVVVHFGAPSFLKPFFWLDRLYQQLKLRFEFLLVGIGRSCRITVSFFLIETLASREKNRCAIVKERYLQRNTFGSLSRNQTGWKL